MSIISRGKFKNLTLTRKVKAMARKKAGGRDWQPGQSGNPNGRPRLPDDLKGAKKLNQTTALIILNKYANMTALELKAAYEDPLTPAFDLLIIKVMTEGIRTGDYQRLNFIMDRLIGRVTDKVEVTHPKPTVIKRLTGEAPIVLGTTEPVESGGE